jgi:hypothetical protein
MARLRNPTACDLPGRQAQPNKNPPPYSQSPTDRFSTTHRSVNESLISQKNFFSRRRNGKQVFKKHLSKAKLAQMQKVTVIIPAFNEEKNIDACIDGLLAQNFRDFKLVIIDDASTDGTVEKNSKADPA